MFYSLTPPKILSRPGLIQQNSSVAFHYLSSQETQRVLEKKNIYIAKHVLLIKIQFGDNLIHLWPPLQHTQKTFYAKVPLQYLLVTVQFSYSLSHHTFTIYKGHIIQSIFSFNSLWVLSAGQSTASQLRVSVQIASSSFCCGCKSKTTAKHADNDCSQLHQSKYETQPPPQTLLNQHYIQQPSFKR